MAPEKIGQTKIKKSLFVNATTATLINGDQATEMLTIK